NGGGSAAVATRATTTTAAAENITQDFFTTKTTKGTKIYGNEGAKSFQRLACAISAGAPRRTTIIRGLDGNSRTRSCCIIQLAAHRAGHARHRADRGGGLYHPSAG